MCIRDSGTMMQSFIMMALMTVLWGLVGYSLAFGEGNAFILSLIHISEPTRPY